MRTKIANALSFIDLLSRESGFSWTIERDHGARILGTGEHYQGPSGYQVEFGHYYTIDEVTGDQILYPNLDIAILALLSLAQQVLAEEGNKTEEERYQEAKELLDL